MSDEKPEAPAPTASAPSRIARPEAPPMQRLTKIAADEARVFNFSTRKTPPPQVVKPKDKN